MKKKGVSHLKFFFGSLIRACPCQPIDLHTTNTSKHHTYFRPVDIGGDVMGSEDDAPPLLDGV